METAVLQHFQRVDPILFRAIRDHESITLSVSDALFSDLCASIVGQQLSSKAADTIWNRFIRLFPGRIVTPQALYQLDPAAMRAVGTSWSKAAYLHNIAAAVLEDGIDFEQLRQASDAEVMAVLTRIKGVGTWTVEMFLMFSLGREDIYSLGDAGLRRAIRTLYALKKDPTPKQLLRISSRWKPYRTYACRILWRSLDQ